MSQVVPGKPAEILNHLTLGSEMAAARVDALTQEVQGRALTRSVKAPPWAPQKDDRQILGAGVQGKKIR